MAGAAAVIRHSSSKTKNRPKAVFAFSLLAAHPVQTAWGFRLTG
jgi:hypothetical protein